MRKKYCLAFLIIAATLIGNFGWAEEKKPGSLEGIEFLTGFGWGKLHYQAGYRLIPLAVDFNFSLKPLLQKINLKPQPLAQFQLEPFINGIYQPDGNVEIGTCFFFKMGLLPQSSKFQPYCKVGAGMVYMSQHTREQSTQFNFIEQGGIGIHYFFRKNIAFTLEGRMRHLSNAGIEYPNHGINTYFVLTGLTYEF